MILWYIASFTFIWAMIDTETWLNGQDPATTTTLSLPSKKWKVKKDFLPILSLVYVDERRCPSRVMLILIITITSKTYTADRYLSFLHRVKYDRIHRTLRTATISPPPSLLPCPKRKHRINKKNQSYIFILFYSYFHLSLSLALAKLGFLFSRSLRDCVP